MSGAEKNYLNQIGPPKLRNFSCKVVKNDGDPVVCRLELELEDHTKKQVIPEKMDLFPETVSTLLEGLTKVRDQLAAVGHHK